MVRKNGAKRKKKNHKNLKNKGPKDGNEMKEVTCRELVIYVPPSEPKVSEKSKTSDSRSKKPKNTYRSKRRERQRKKKEHKRGDCGDNDYPEEEEEEEEDEDDLDFGGEYDEIIRTRPTPRPRNYERYNGRGTSTGDRTYSSGLAYDRDIHRLLTLMFLRRMQNLFD